MNSFSKINRVSLASKSIYSKNSFCGVVKSFNGRATTSSNIGLLHQWFQKRFFHNKQQIALNKDLSESPPKNKEMEERVKKLIQEKERYYMKMMHDKEVMKRKAITRERLKEMESIAEKKVDKEFGNQLEIQLSVCEKLFRDITTSPAYTIPFSVCGNAMSYDEKRWKDGLLEWMKQDEEKRTSIHEHRLNLWKELINGELVKLIDGLEECLIKYREVLGEEYEEKMEIERERESMMDREEKFQESLAEFEIPEEKKKSFAEIKKVFKNHKSLMKEDNLHETAVSIDYVSSIPVLSHRLSYFFKEFNILSAIFIQIYFELSAEVETILFSRYVSLRNGQMEQRIQEQMNQHFTSLVLQNSVMTSEDVEMIQKYHNLGEEIFKLLHRMSTSIPDNCNYFYPSFIQDDFIIPYESIGFWNAILGSTVKLRNNQLVGNILEHMKTLNVHINSLSYRHFITLLLLINRRDMVKKLVGYLDKTDTKLDAKAVEILLQCGINVVSRNKI